MRAEEEVKISRVSESEMEKQCMQCIAKLKRETAAPIPHPLSSSREIPSEKIASPPVSAVYKKCHKATNSFLWGFFMPFENVKRGTMLYGDFLAVGIGHLGKYSGTVYLEKVKLWERQPRPRIF